MSTLPFGSLHLFVHKESNDVTAARRIKFASLSQAQSTSSRYADAPTMVLPVAMI